MQTGISPHSPRNTSTQIECAADRADPGECCQADGGKGNAHLLHTANLNISFLATKIHKRIRLRRTKHQAQPNLHADRHLPLIPLAVLTCALTAPLIPKALPEFGSPPVPLSSTVDREAQSEALLVLSLDLSPKWSHTALNYVQSPDLHGKFHNILEIYFHLEEYSFFANGKGLPHTFSSKHRPEPIHWWISRARTGCPPIPDILSVIAALKWWEQKSKLGMCNFLCGWRLWRISIAWVMERVIESRGNDGNSK
ncbi:hypothetical protein PISMIDRAFT_16280 [Pisolithus microcarpus 441]|uniref:Uncharacterized protein n=1 Tax=Pisolithus microcarpus 441 TaxID=765257 RepID=A0A0C9YPR6_9AGAM|nr:hypothetical protein PISMIDRAFT_16280 [Pisolithus microcarpus 441]